MSQDVGGIAREYFYSIMKEMLTEAYGLFTTASTEEFSYKIREDSFEVGGWQDLFHFFGKLIGKAFFDRVPLNLCLNRAIFMALLKQKDFKFADFKLIDINVHNSLQFFQENDLAQFEEII